MTLSQIRSRIEALQRRFAVPLAALRLRRISEQICDEWSVAAAGNMPLPGTQSIIRRISGTGLRFNTFAQLHSYIERCRAANECPEPRSVATVLFPKAAANGIMHAIFQWDLNPA